MEVDKSICYGQLDVLEGTMNAERSIKGFRATSAPPDNVYLMEGLVYFSRMMLNHILQLLQQQGFIREESSRKTCSRNNIWN